MSEQAWQAKAFSRSSVHHSNYYEMRLRFALSAQVVARCIAKVVDAYKKGKIKQRTFHKHGSIAYDARILRWGIEGQYVSIWTLGGRQHMPFVCGQKQRELLQHQRGESDLIYREGAFYLHATCELEEPQSGEPEGFLGVDLGLVNIAVDSDGESFSGARVKSLRHRHRRLRTKLQSKRTQSAKRRLRKRRRKERRFARDVNHCISKKLVAKAQRTKRAIVLEDLKGIRKRVRVRKPQRASMHSWSFHQLRQFVEYKARLAGVVVMCVDPRNTSRTCAECGHVGKENRVSRDRFHCQVCSFAGEADLIAAINIGRRGAVSCPNADSPFGERAASPVL